MNPNHFACDPIYFTLLIIKSAKELSSQKKSILVTKTATYAHSVEEKTSVFFVETLPTISNSISLNKPDCGKAFGLLEENITYLIRSYFSINVHGNF